MPMGPGGYGPSMRGPPPGTNSNPYTFSMILMENLYMYVMRWLHSVLFERENTSFFK